MSFQTYKPLVCAPSTTRAGPAPPALRALSSLWCAEESVGLAQDESCKAQVADLRIAPGGYFWGRSIAVDPQARWLVYDGKSYPNGYAGGIPVSPSKWPNGYAGVRFAQLCNPGD